MVRELEPTGVMLALTLAVPIASVARVDKGHSPSTQWPSEFLPAKQEYRLSHLSSGAPSFRWAGIEMFPALTFYSHSVWARPLVRGHANLFGAGLIPATASNPLILPCSC